jgi:hypothetical protein
MKITLPPEVVDEVLIKELSSFFSQLREQLHAIENGTYDDFPTYSTDLDEEYAGLKLDYEACKRILTYYGGPSCVVNII